MRPGGDCQAKAHDRRPDTQPLYQGEPSYIDLPASEFLGQHFVENHSAVVGEFRRHFLNIQRQQNPTFRAILIRRGRERTHTKNKVTSKTKPAPNRRLNVSQTKVTKPQVYTRKLQLPAREPAAKQNDADSEISKRLQLVQDLRSEFACCGRRCLPSVLNPGAEITVEAPRHLRLH